MARVRFTHDFDWKPTPQSAIAFRAGQEYTVRRECADAAVKAGAGDEIAPPRQEKADGSSE